MSSVCCDANVNATNDGLACAALRRNLQVGRDEERGGMDWRMKWLGLVGLRSNTSMDCFSDLSISGLPVYRVQS